jgi:hypothetical protein
VTKGKLPPPTEPFTDPATGKISEVWYRWLSQVSTQYGQAREVLTEARTYYVRTDGNDSNSGRSDDAGGAFLTWGAATDAVTLLDTNGYGVTISAGDEGAAKTFTENVFTPTPVGSGVIYFTAAVPNTIITSTSGDTIRAGGWHKIQFNNLKITSSAGTGILVCEGAFVEIKSGMNFGTCAVYHIRVHDTRALVYCISTSIEISGGAQYHVSCEANGNYYLEVATVTLTDTPAFSGAFVGAHGGGYIQSLSCTFTGAATGTRYIVSSNAVIGTDTGANHFPGNSPGISLTGGQYA